MVGLWKSPGSDPRIKINVKGGGQECPPHMCLAIWYRAQP
jgi:hypothetical protein